jgi:hypothetical protein
MEQNIEIIVKGLADRAKKMLRRLFESNMGACTLIDHDTVNFSNAISVREYPQVAIVDESCLDSEYVAVLRRNRVTVVPFSQNYTLKHSPRDAVTHKVIQEATAAVVAVMEGAESAPALEQPSTSDANEEDAD